MDKTLGEIKNTTEHDIVNVKNESDNCNINENGNNDNDSDSDDSDSNDSNNSNSETSLLLCDRPNDDVGKKPTQIHKSEKISEHFASIIRGSVASYDNEDDSAMVSSLVKKGFGIATLPFIGCHTLYCFVMALEDPERMNRVLVKIGYTHDIAQRVNQLKYEYGCDVFLIGLKCIASRQMETLFHRHIRTTKKELHYPIEINGKPKNEIYLFSKVLYDEFMAVQETRCEIDKVTTKHTNENVGIDRCQVFDDGLSKWFQDHYASDNNDDKLFVALSDVLDEIRLSEFYGNISREERKMITLKYLVSHFSCNVVTKKYYRESVDRKVGNERAQKRHVLLFWKLKNVADD